MNNLKSYDDYINEAVSKSASNWKKYNPGGMYFLWNADDLTLTIASGDKLQMKFPTIWKEIKIHDVTRNEAEEILKILHENDPNQWDILVKSANFDASFKL